MSNIEKSYSFHSVIVPANHVVTFECVINEGCTTKPVFNIIIPSMNISNVTRVVGDSVTTLQ